MRRIWLIAAAVVAVAGCDDDMDDLRVEVNDGEVVIQGQDEDGTTQTIRIISDEIKVDQSTPAPKGDVVAVPHTKFDAVATEGFVDVVASVGPTARAELRCDADTAKRVETVLDGTLLVVRTKARRGRGGQPGHGGSAPGCELHAQAPDWRAFATTGSGDVTASGPLSSVEHVHTTGSGTVTVSGLDAQRVIASSKGSGDIILQGRVGRLFAQTDGSGDIEAGNLVANNAALTTTGSGDITAHATADVLATTNGSGDIVVGGKGKLEAHRSGSGSIRR